MKNEIQGYLLTGFFLTVVLLAQGQKPERVKLPDGSSRFILKGKVTGREGEKIYLSYQGVVAKHNLDSCIVKDGRFFFSGMITEPTNASLFGKRRSGHYSSPDYKELFLEPVEMEVDLQGNSFKNGIVKGSLTQDELEGLEKQKMPIKMEMQPLSDQYALANDKYITGMMAKMDDKILDTLKERASALHDQFEPYTSRMLQIDYVFIAGHPDSYVSAHLMRYYAGGMTLDSAKSFYKGFSRKLQESSYGKELVLEIQKIEAGSPGSMPKDFVTKDINGQPFSLSRFKGKSYVLIDFWASWCVPCRHSNPHVLELFHRYHEKGFEVIGVSDDDNQPGAWRKAVSKDGVGIWHNVLRGYDSKKSWDGEPNQEDINEKFGIQSLPTKILIDKNGTIVGRYGGGEDEDASLDKKLAEIFL